MHFIIHTQDTIKDSGGIISSTGFSMSSIDSTKEYFLDDDGSGNLRIYYLVSGTRVYSSLNAGSSRLYKWKNNTRRNYDFCCV